MLMGLVASSIVSSGALERGEEAARAEVERYVGTVLFRPLTADDLEAEIDGPDYRDLLIAVQGGIMTDPDVARVRIWKPDGTLIFSTDERDRQGQVDRHVRSHVEAAIQGRTESVMVDEPVAPGRSVTARPEQLLQTYTPLRVPNRVAVLAAAEIDHRYAALRETAKGPWATWRLIFGLGLLLGFAMVAISLWFPSPEPVSSSRRRRSRLGWTWVPGSAGRERGPVADDQPVATPIAEAESAREAEAAAAETRRELRVVLGKLDDAEAAGRALAARMEQEAEPEDLILKLDELADEVRSAEAAARVAEERAVVAEERARAAEERVRNLEAARKELEQADGDVAARLRSMLVKTTASKKSGGASRTGGAGRTNAEVPSKEEEQEEAELERSLRSGVEKGLRSPVSSILGLTLTLKREVSGGEAEDLVRRLSSTAKRLDQLVADLGDLSSIADGSVKLKRRRSDVQVLVGRVVDDWEPTADRAVNVDPQPVKASVDSLRVRQIVEALLENARERTEPGAPLRVAVRADVDEGGVVIAVDDGGAPEPRVDVGLALAGRLVELHGGRLWFEEGAGGGASFRVFLPERAPERAQPSRRSRGEAVDGDDGSRGRAEAASAG